MVVEGGRKTGGWSLAVHEHKFRDESSKKPQTKIKCSSCGCWARRGENCYFCNTQAPASPPSTVAASQSIARTSPGMSAPVSSHKFREESSKKLQVKIKCTSCGCWADRAGQCYHCTAPTPAFPPNTHAAAEALSRRSSNTSSDCVHNHKFRDESSKGLQKKIKCSSCGCWADRGSYCYQCDARTAGYPPSSNAASDSISRASSSASASVQDHKFRDESAKSLQKKIKCASCGCWAKRGSHCYHCKTRMAGSPPSATAATESITRISSSEGSCVHSHKFRDEAPKKLQVKIKCTSCGCWADRAGVCYFCKAETPKSPPTTISASDSFTRRRP